MIITIPSKDGRSFECFAKPQPTLSSNNKSGNNKHGSTKSDNYLKKVKQEHEKTPRVGNRSSGFVVPLYTKVPQLGDSGLISSKEFAKHYELCSKGLNPKKNTNPEDVIVEEVHKCFRHVHNKNGYSYVFSEDFVVITKVESLWMVIY
jgi:hypothetical protein